MSTRSLRYNTLNRHVPKSRLASTDRDALAFLEAATIYNENQQKAIIELVRRLKAAGLWSKMKAIYPFVGGTAASHKWNLKDPRDVDAAFRLTFTGGFTHSSTGVDANGTTGWAKTFFVPSTNATLGSVSYGCYVRENDDFSTGGSLNDMGCGVAAGNAPHMAMLIRLSNTFYGDCWNNSTGRVQTANTDRRGFYIASRTTTAVFKCFRNGAQIGTTNTTTQSQTDLNGLTMSLALFAFNRAGDSPTNFSKAEQAFAFIGDGLTDAEASTFNRIVDLYQKRLGRAV